MSRRDTTGDSPHSCLGAPCLMCRRAAELRMGDRELPAARADPARSSSGRSRSRASASAPGSTSSRRPSRCCSRSRRAAPRWSRPGNLNTTQQEALDYLAAHGVRPVGTPTSDPAEHDAYLREVLAFRAASSCSTTAATSSSAGSSSRTRGSSAAPRRRPPGGCGSSRSGTQIGPAGARHQRQPDQAVRREPARGRARAPSSRTCGSRTARRTASA